MQIWPPLVFPLLLLAIAVTSAGQEFPPSHWQRSTRLPGLGEAFAVAFDPPTGRVAVGDEQGVWLLDGSSAALRVLRRGPVRDLAFSSDAGLYAATDQGLFHLDAGGAVSQCRLGAAAREVGRLLVAPDFVLVATADGAFSSKDGQRWSRLDAGLPAGAVDALALRPGADSAELWLIVNGAVHRATLRSGGDRVFAEDVESVSIAGGGRRGAVDLSTSVPGAEVAVLSRWGLSLYQAGSWQSFRPALPPGAEPLRLASAAGRLWIATDRGLLEAASPSGPWQRVAPPAGNTQVAALAAGRALVYAASGRGLLVGRTGSAPLEPSLPAHLAQAPRATEPSVHQLHVAALRYLDLRPERIRELQRGVRRRGWLPRFELRSAYAGERNARRDHDETFTSGAPRLFHDQERARGRDFGISATLVWELADIAYHPESIDVSKEVRELIELRDDVLDEITQLYFERRRVLLELASLPSQSAGAAALLRLRAEELASGLDAWTGGWWSRAAPTSESHSPRNTPEETDR